MVEALLRGITLGNLPEAVMYRLLPRPALHRMVAGQYPFDIAIQDRRPQAHAQAGDGAGSGTADAGQRLQPLDAGGEFPAMLADHYLRGAVQVAGAAVVAQPGPQVQHLVRRRGGQGKIGRASCRKESRAVYTPCDY